jgi:hypothetical protein
MQVVAYLLGREVADGKKVLGWHAYLPAPARTG